MSVRWPLICQCYRNRLCLLYLCPAPIACPRVGWRSASAASRARPLDRRPTHPAGAGQATTATMATIPTSPPSRTVSILVCLIGSGRFAHAACVAHKVRLRQKMPAFLPLCHTVRLCRQVVPHPQAKVSTQLGSTSCRYDHVCFSGCWPAQWGKQQTSSSICCACPPAHSS